MAQMNNRETRQPTHHFNLRTRPFQIQPCLLAPVIPGETMNFALLQSRVVSNPVANPLIGWWAEYYMFYVKLRDLTGRDDFTEMLLDPAKDMSSYNEAADVKYYHHAGTINWTKLCLQRVVEEYFRNEGEAWNIATLDGIPLASVNGESWLNSAISGDTNVHDDFNVDLDASGTTTVWEVEQALNNWRLMQNNNWTNMSFEDYLPCLRREDARCSRTPYAGTHPVYP